MCVCVSLCQSDSFLSYVFAFLSEGMVIGRGCSTTDKVFYKECQTHSYGDTVEKMCFCSFFLCNAAPRAASGPSLALLALALAFLAWCTTSCDNYDAMPSVRTSSIKKKKIKLPDMTSETQSVTTFLPQTHKVSVH